MTGRSLPEGLAAWAVVALATSLVAGCGYTKEFAPIKIQPFSPRQPNQQRVVAQATFTAVRQAATQAALQRYSGRTARIEVNGVFPHSEEDLLGYVGSILAGEAARVGMVVLPPKEDKQDTVVVYGGRKAPATDPPDDADKAEVRLVASVEWGGVDLIERRSTNGWPLAGWILLPLAGAGMAAAAEDDFASPLLGVGSLLGDVLWIIFDDTTSHTFTMLGRTRVSVRAIPQVSGLAATMGVGEGESSMVIDSDADSGYSLTVDLPKD